MVNIVVGEAATAFVHAGDIQHPVARKVAGDLHVTDEGAGGGNLYRSVPRAAVITGVGDGESTARCPRKYTCAQRMERQGCYQPNQIPIVARAIVNAKMGPAI